MTALLQFLIRATYKCLFFCFLRRCRHTYVGRMCNVNEFPEACFLGASKRKLTHLHNCAQTHLFIMGHIAIECGPRSSVGIATELRTGRSGIESQWGRDFPPVQTGPGAHPAPCKVGIGSFPGVKCGRSVPLTTHPLLVPRSWKSRAIPLHTLCATPACNGITLPFLL